MLFRELMLAGARRVPLSSGAVYSVDIYISLHICIYASLHSSLPSLSLQAFSCLLHLSIPFHFFLNTPPLEDVLQLSPSYVYPDTFQSPSLGCIFSRTPPPTPGWGPSQTSKRTTSSSGPSQCTGKASGRRVRAWATLYWAQSGQVPMPARNQRSGITTLSSQTFWYCSHWGWGQ